MIKSHTDLHQWHYTGSKCNPADYSSRGIDVADDKALQKWFQEPSFLRKPDAEWGTEDKKEKILQDDPEIKKLNCVSAGKDILEALESMISSWHKMKRVVAMMLRYKKLLLKKIKKGESEGKIINNSLLKDAKIEVIKMVQAKKKLLQKLGPL